MWWDAKHEVFFVGYFTGSLLLMAGSLKLLGHAKRELSFNPNQSYE
jgi:hypothetical protein